MQRGRVPRNPYARQPLPVSCYGFKIVDGILKVPLGNRQYFDIPLNNYVKNVISDPSLRIRSFTLTVDAVSICYSKEVTEISCIEVRQEKKELNQAVTSPCLQRCSSTFQGE
jgi:hypothetical protein